MHCTDSIPKACVPCVLLSPYLPPLPPRYLVKLRPDVPASRVDEICDLAESNNSTLYTGTCLKRFKALFNGMLMAISGQSLLALLDAESALVQFVEVEGQVLIASAPPTRAAAAAAAAATAASAATAAAGGAAGGAAGDASGGDLDGSPSISSAVLASASLVTRTQRKPLSWGLDRIDQRPGGPPLDGAYSYPASAGAGVHVYVVDTGVRCSHSDFYFSDSRLNLLWYPISPLSLPLSPLSPLPAGRAVLPQRLLLLRRPAQPSLVPNFPAVSPPFPAVAPSCRAACGAPTATFTSQTAGSTFSGTQFPRCLSPFPRCRPFLQGVRCSHSDFYFSDSRLNLLWYPISPLSLPLSPLSPLPAGRAVLPQRLLLLRRPAQPSLVPNFPAVSPPFPAVAPSCRACGAPTATFTSQTAGSTFSGTQFPRCLSPFPRCRPFLQGVRCSHSDFYFSDGRLNLLWYPISPLSLPLSPLSPLPAGRAVLPQRLLLLRRPAQPSLVPNFPAVSPPFPAVAPSCRACGAPTATFTSQTAGSTFSGTQFPRCLSPFPRCRPFLQGVRCSHSDFYFSDGRLNLLWYPISPLSLPLSPLSPLPAGRAVLPQRLLLLRRPAQPSLVPNFPAVSPPFPAVAPSCRACGAPTATFTSQTADSTFSGTQFPRCLSPFPRCRPFLQGVRCSHSDFYFSDSRLNPATRRPASRCLPGVDTVGDGRGDGMSDCNGHGTHCAGMTLGGGRLVVLLLWESSVETSSHAVLACQEPTLAIPLAVQRPVPSVLACRRPSPSLAGTVAGLVSGVAKSTFILPPGAHHGLCRQRGLLRHPTPLSLRPFPLPGTVAGLISGVAKSAFIHPVRTMDCGGNGAFGDILEGLDWIARHYQAPAVVSMSITMATSASLDAALKELVEKTGITVAPAVVFMSITMAASASLDAALKELVEETGITVVAAAGNFFSLACNYSPADSDDVIAVASSTSSDTMSWFSNYGSCTDIFAPGEEIVSAGSASDTAMATMSGTSMACPHVSGAAALYLSMQPAARPRDVRKALYDTAYQNAIQAVKPSTVPRLLSVNFRPLLVDVAPRSFLSLLEGATARIKVLLLKAPAADVVFTATASDASVASFSPSRLTFPARRTPAAQYITIHLAYSPTYLDRATLLAFTFTSKDSAFGASLEGYAVAYDKDVCKAPCGQSVEQPKVVPALPFYYEDDSTHYRDLYNAKLDSCHDTGPDVVFQYTPPQNMVRVWGVQLASEASQEVCDSTRYRDLYNAKLDSCHDTGPDVVFQYTPPQNMVVPALPFYYEDDSTHYRDLYNAKLDSCHDTGPDVVFQYTPPYHMVGGACTSLSLTEFDSVLSAYERTKPGAKPVSIGCNDDSCGTKSKLSGLILAKGTTYFFMVDGSSAPRQSAQRRSPPCALNPWTPCGPCLCCHRITRPTLSSRCPPTPPPPTPPPPTPPPPTPPPPTPSSHPSSSHPSSSHPSSSHPSSSHPSSSHPSSSHPSSSHPSSSHPSSSHPSSSHPSSSHPSSSHPSSSHPSSSHPSSSHRASSESGAGNAATPSFSFASPHHLTSPPRFIYMNGSTPLLLAPPSGPGVGARDDGAGADTKGPYHVLTGPWGECSVSCGVGQQQRIAWCVDAQGMTAQSPLASCPLLPAVPTTQPCQLAPCTRGYWDVTQWQGCNVPCGGGVNVRSVVCRDAVQGNMLDDSRCSSTPPPTNQSCNTQPCSIYTWRPSGWSPCQYSLTLLSDAHAGMTRNSSSSSGGSSRSTSSTSSTSNTSRSSSGGTGWSVVEEEVMRVYGWRRRDIE
ncbi:unnamed protein product, partial [Closterium sp. Yama58-4]